MEVNTCAARSLAEGLDQTLMVHQLGITGVLRQTLSSTMRSNRVSPSWKEFAIK